MLCCECMWVIWVPLDFREYYLDKKWVTTTQYIIERYLHILQSLGCPNYTNSPHFTPLPSIEDNNNVLRYIIRSHSLCFLWFVVRMPFSLLSTTEWPMKWKMYIYTT